MLGVYSVHLKSTGKKENKQIGKMKGNNLITNIRELDLMKIKVQV